jgi:hypothetical protein
MVDLYQKMLMGRLKPAQEITSGGMIQVSVLGSVQLNNFILHLD